MAARTKPQPLRSGGALWGPRRVAAGISLARLASESGLSKSVLSLMENGRINPTPEEHDRVTDALFRLSHPDWTEGELALGDK